MNGLNGHKIVNIFIFLLIPLLYIGWVRIEQYNKDQDNRNFASDNNTPTRITFEDIATVTFPFKATLRDLPINNKLEFPPYADCFDSNPETGAYLYNYSANPHRYLSPDHKAQDSYNNCDSGYYKDPVEGTETFYKNVHVETINKINFKICGSAKQDGIIYLVSATAIDKNRGVTLSILNSSSDDPNKLWVKMDNFLSTFSFIK